jgi:RNA polymerase sigma factor (sigma-70 family)
VITIGLERHECRYLRLAFEHEIRIRAYLRSKARDPQLIEELLQEIYVRLLELGSSNDTEIRNVLAFSLQIASNLVSDHWRSRHQTTGEELEEFPAVAHEASAEARYDLEEQSKQLFRAIHDLPERCGQALRLKVYRGLTYREIARELGTSEGTVGGYLTRAMHLLSAALKAPLSRQPNRHDLSGVAEEEDS